MAKKQSSETESLKDLVIEAILEKKGQDVVSLDLRDIHDTVSDYFIIAHGDSNTQVNAIFQSILDATKEKGHRPFHSEGMKNGEWVIVDFVDVVAHIFYREKRDFYMLEELWNDAKVTKHDSGPAIKPKVVRQTNRKYEPEENTLEEIEKTLPKSDRTPVVKGQFFGKPFGKKASPRIDPKTGEKKTGELSPREKKYAEKKQSDKKFVDKKIQERKAASKKAPALKTGENKILKGAKVAHKKTSIKKK